MYACVHIPGATSESSAALLEVARTFSPLVEADGAGTVVVPVAALRRLIGGPHEIASEVARRAHERGLDGRIGIASNPDTAILAARNLPGVTVIPRGEETKYVGEFRLDTLPLDEDAFDVLKRWGIRTLDEFGALPETGIAERFGTTGVYLQNLARGIADRPLRPVYDAAVFRERFELDHGLRLLEPLLFVLARLLNELCAKLTAHGFATADVRLALEIEGGGEVKRGVRMPYPSRDAKAMLKLLQLDLEAHPPGAPVFAAAMEVVPVEPRTVQGGLFVPLAPEPEKLEITLAKIRAMVGERNVGSPELRNTYRPGAWVVSGQWPVASGQSRFSGEWRVASGESRLAFRYFTPGLKARVELREGMPKRVDAERGIYGLVVQSAGPWRTSGDWWREDAWDRDEWDIGLNNGAVYRIFVERPAERWVVEGAYD
jgi:protein ImuB